MTQFNQIDFDVPASRNTSEFLVEDEEKERSLSTEVNLVSSFVRFFFFEKKTSFRTEEYGYYFRETCCWCVRMWFDFLRECNSYERG